jgi:uncharacterized protein YlzI (FlbEa/FlbD family)
MIALLRPNGQPVFVNPDLIETAERNEDDAATTVLLTTGNILVVSDDPETITERIVGFRRRLNP